MSKRKIIAITVCAVLIATALLLQLDFSKIKISTKSGSPGTVSGLDDLGGALEFAYMRNLLTSELVGGKMTEKEIVQAAEEIKRDCMTAEISIGSSSAYEYTVRTKETQGENSSSGSRLGDILGGLGGLGDLGGLGGLGNILGSLTGTKVTIVTTTQLLSADIRLKCAFGESRTYYDIDAALSSNNAVNKESERINLYMTGEVYFEIKADGVAVYMNLSKYEFVENGGSLCDLKQGEMLGRWVDCSSEPEILSGISAVLGFVNTRLETAQKYSDSSRASYVKKGNSYRLSSVSLESYICSLFDYQGIIGKSTKGAPDGRLTFDLSGKRSPKIKGNYSFDAAISDEFEQSTEGGGKVTINLSGKARGSESISIRLCGIGSTEVAPGKNFSPEKAVLGNAKNGGGDAE